jgi:hypothetical protein
MKSKTRPISVTVVKVKPIIRNEEKRYSEALAGNSPEANGNIFLQGLARSLFLSKYWLKMKIDEVIKENETAMTIVLEIGNANSVLPIPKINNQPIQLLTLRERKKADVGKWLFLSS